MPDCRTGTDFEKSPHVYVSRRNTEQRDPITTRTNRKCCANVKKEVTFRNLFLCGNSALTL